MPAHNAMTGTELHEPKNMSAATAGAADVGKVVVSKGDGTTEVRKLEFTEIAATAIPEGKIAVADGLGDVTAQTSCRMGWSNYNDVATVSTPIVLTPVATFVNLTNDGAGAQSINTYELPEVTNLWDVATNTVDLSDLQIGDTLDIRVDMDVTTTGANHEIEVRLDMDTAPIEANFPLLLIRENFKSAGTFNIVRFYSFYIGSAAVRDGVHKIQAKSDTGSTDDVVVNGWYLRAVTRSDY
jgi:hypothetical protein